MLLKIYGVLLRDRKIVRKVCCQTFLTNGIKFTRLDFCWINSDMEACDTEAELISAGAIMVEILTEEKLSVFIMRELQEQIAITIPGYSVEVR